MAKHQDKELKKADVRKCIHGLVTCFLVNYVDQGRFIYISSKIFAEDFRCSLIVVDSFARYMRSNYNVFHVPQI